MMYTLHGLRICGDGRGLRWLNDVNHRTFQVRRRVAIHTVFGIALVLQLWWWVAGQESQPNHQSQVATFAVEKHGAPLLLSVAFDSFTGPFVLDSGAGVHVFDKRYESALGTRIATKRAKTAGSLVSVALFNPPRLLVGQITVKSDHPVASLDLSRFSEAIGRDVHGILGMPFFQDRVVSCDFDRGLIRIPDLSESAESWGVAVPLFVNSTTGLAYVRDVTIGSEKMSFMLDTGTNGSVSMAKNDFDRLTSKGVITSLRVSHAATASGDVQRRSGRLGVLRVGPFEHASLIVNESSSNKLGLGYLRRFRATIDIPRRRLYLARGQSCAANDDADMSGLHLRWRDKRVVVDVVDRYSPGHRVGILNGDVVLDVNGTPATGETLNRLRRAFRSDVGHECRLKILRGERILNTQFTLKDYADWKRPSGSQHQ